MEKRPASRTAHTALWLGIAALLLGWLPLLGWGLILAAIITGAIGISDTKNKPGRGHAIAGLILGTISALLVITTTLLFAGLLLTIINTDIDGGIIDYDASGEELAITISGINQNRTISEEAPVRLAVEGINNSVYVADGTHVTTLRLSGIGNSASLPADTQATYTSQGIDNQARTR